MRNRMGVAAIVRGLRRLSSGVAIVVATVVVGAGAPAMAATCETLADAKLPNVVIVSAQPIPAGDYKPPGSPVTYPGLPAFCRVVAMAHPVPDSSIGMEVWLPTSGWNGRYQQVGNHGFAGVIHWNEMAPQLARGFAVAATDDGHTAPAGAPYNVDWAYGHPAKVDDLAWRGVHELAKNAKLLIASFYGQPLRYSYFNGCSNGGRQGLREAQQFPADFDGILFGGAAAYWTNAATQQLVLSLNLQKAGLNGARGEAALAVSQDALAKACDRADGVADGIITAPTRCRFDPHTLVCKAGASSDDCITKAQADAIAANSRPVIDPISKKWVFSGISPGSEFEQVRLNYTKGPAPFAVSNFQLAANNPAWQTADFDLHKDLPKLDRILGVMNTIDPDLHAFQAHGGKMMQYHGWDDGAFTAGWTVQYYNNVVARTGKGSLAATQKFYRLFMLPGVGHCGGGPGPYNFGQETQTAVSDDPEHDAVSALMAWVEHGTAPQKLIATRFKGDNPKQGIALQRPIYPYPTEAAWDGKGDTNSAASFRAAAARKAR
jgi:feruloyl esterase